MLVLTRNDSQSIIISAGGEEIEVKILHSSGPVKLGVKAARHVQVDRLEVHQRKLGALVNPTMKEALVNAIANPSRRLTRAEAREVAETVAEVLTKKSSVVTY